jgi:DnaK suppressor protein
METAAASLSADYIAQQKQRLLDLRAELRGDTQETQTEEDALQDSTSSEAESSGDGAQKNTLRDNDTALIAHNALRVRNVDRALQKIEDGTYGLSDRSGKPIPKARLDALPESLTTVDEGEQD